VRNYDLYEVDGTPRPLCAFGGGAETLGLFIISGGYL
jgi:hypothetical protein